MDKDYPVTDTFLAVNGGNQRWGLGGNLFVTLSAFATLWFKNLPTSP